MIQALSPGPSLTIHQFYSNITPFMRNYLTSDSHTLTALRFQITEVFFFLIPQIGVFDGWFCRVTNPLFLAFQR